MEKRTIREIGAILAEAKDEQDPLFLEAARDTRKGVQELIRKWKKAKAEELSLKDKFFEMTAYERKARKEGFRLVAGTDEVGRGPLAGPVTAAAVILPEDFFLPGLDDSKKLTRKKREEYEEIIKREAISYNICFISAQEIDEINILQASIKAMKHAAAALSPQPDYLLIDAVKLEMPYPSEAVIKGDSKSVTIAAASILAKNARDRFMEELAKKYPVYGFDRNAGYATKEHMAAIEMYGVTPVHRKTFAPIKK
ncbi:ribonuclease HII [Bacillus sp. FJAT-27225]|uniref:ribonuclease HII n=1 Tax=Bacillus sp. FJAT-27225 TaxID=1743144 RepID=UPI00080C2F5C|nr:ribonuclease HII [Bacillus sp. FJAT-27225]OCA85457.1 ribonuclease HII [Bacillus sp. FJAT-27225]